MGRIGCRDGDSVYVVPISFVYDDGCAYGHSAEGRKLTLMRARPEVCFEVDDIRGLSDWRSVVAHCCSRNCTATTLGKRLTCWPPASRRPARSPTRESRHRVTATARA